MLYVVRMAKSSFNQRLAMNEDEFKCEWGGSIRVITSDGRIVNAAEELNRLEKKS